MPQLSERHEAALAYAEAGIAVFPCVVGGKIPATSRGFHDATTSPSKINEWWAVADYNFAFCPADSNLFVIDIDPGADLSILEKLPATHTIRTPRGGYHLYYEGTGRTSVGKLAAHVDTRGPGSYVLAPPSVVDGQPYTLERELDYAPIPLWVTEKLAQVETPVKAAVEEKDLPGNIERATKVLERYVELGDVAIEGNNGDQRTYKLCCEMLDLGLSSTTAIELIEKIWNPHCIPSWETQDLELKFSNAETYHQNETGAFGVDDAQKVFGNTVKKLFPVKLSRFHFKNETEVDEEPDPTWIVKDLISERSTVMLYGPSGSYKSFLALDICLSVASGKPTFGSDTEAGLVFYGALEGRAHLKKGRRAWRLLKQIEGKIDNFFVGLAPMIAAKEEIQEFGDQIRARCGDRRPKLIVIDTLSKAMAGMNENDAADANRFIRFCDSLVEDFGCTVLAIHHSGKEEQRGARGSSAFQAGFDTVLEVKAYKTTKAVEVWVRKHKDAEERELPWTFEGRVMGPSLVFEATTAAQHRLLTGEGKELTPKTVGGTLKALGAFGESSAVTTAVLATQLTPAREDESVEQRAAAIARTSRALMANASKLLEGYAHKKGKGVLWSLTVAGE